MLLGAACRKCRTWAYDILHVERALLDLQFKSRKGKDLRVSYPCVVLNVMVAKHNTNDQYQTLVDGQTKRYETSSRMSIEFEVDGPYKAGLCLHHPCLSSDYLPWKLA